ncbi:IS1096 element passenger TnpR family protein [Sunxiuqinia sp. A32]|uniref:IS1096 element passenger TnpR family protein n=1 Tax=Sunxiuqinia sp. A32 TaxID=3461496 RepID=UPI004045CB54
MTSIENPDFLRSIEIDSQNTFADLHRCIQETCGYEPDQMASFFVPGEKHGSQLEITLLDLGFSGMQSRIMGKTTLNEFITDVNQRLLYVFDFFNDRSFYIELTQISMEKHLQETKVTLKKGEAPAQVIEQEMHDQGIRTQNNGVVYQDYGDLDDYNEIFGEMEDLVEGD